MTLSTVTAYPTAPPEVKPARQPTAHDALRAIIDSAPALPLEAARRQEIMELQGLGAGDADDGLDDYGYAQCLIEVAIAELRGAAREIKRLRAHAHDWGADDYCRICGADGRA